ncbi:MAG: potassium transporter TrkG [Akkermansia sp.]|nr:potassium transporter TrkG [Akkermansia sp.]
MSKTHEQQYRVLELPEIISGLLAMLIVLWEACFAELTSGPSELQKFEEGVHLLLCGVVCFNTLAVIIHFITKLVKRKSPGRFLWWQLATGVPATFTFIGGLNRWLPPFAFTLSIILSFILGIYSLITLVAIYRERKQLQKQRNKSQWSPAVVFFTWMVSFVLISTLLLLTPGATYTPINFTDAFFTCASAISITGLTCVDIAGTFTPLGKLVLLIDIQIGALGVMTFTYFVFLMVGKQLAVRDRVAISALLDQQGVNIIPALIKAVIFVTFGVEIIGATLLYLLWRQTPAAPQDLLWFRALFHAVSAFCNAGISLFPNNMAESCVAHDKAIQGVMMVLTLAGTLGFSVYLEIITRLHNRLKGKRNPLRWSTNSWLLVRVTLIILIVGTVGLTLLGLLEPSEHPQSADFNLWESTWNTIGRSAGFTITDISSYGQAYQLFLCALMFIGGNPAGTGGGVFATVFALCVLEVLRVLRGQQDLELHGRRIARNTVERAMATVVLSTFWIAASTLVLVMLEPTIAGKANGTLRLFFLEVSAFTTTGYSICDPAELSAFSKFFICANMLFGRVGMFTFMLIFIKQKSPSPVRYPETRLPLT